MITIHSSLYMMISGIYDIDHISSILMIVSNLWSLLIYDMYYTSTN